MPKIFLVRHGQASLGAEDYDMLSPLGTEQSRHLGMWFSRCGMRFDRLLAGRNRRHRQTALACLEELGMDAGRADLQIDRGFDEYDHLDILRPLGGDLHTPAGLAAWFARQPSAPQRAFQEIFSAAFQRWVSGRYDGDYAESWRGFRARCVASLENLADSCERGSTAIVFTSGGPVTAICQHLLGIPDDRIMDLHYAIPNTSVSRLLCRPGRIGLGYFNSIAHLEHAGRVDAITYR